MTVTSSGKEFIPPLRDHVHELSRHSGVLDGWVELQSGRKQLDGRLRRFTGRPSGLFDEDGNSIPLRTHHPEAPHRNAPHPRFARLSAPSRGSARV